jgi:hypothetical protein
MKIVDKLFQEIKNFSYERKARTAHIKPNVLYDVPYVSQFAKPEHAEPSLKKELAPLNDPHWKETGAESPDRYAQWAFTMCGMASAAMALGYFKDTYIRPVELAEDALKAGVYQEEKDGISSMRYKEFAKGGCV